jgi:D-alanyl-D-alanine carboxypeptidase
VSTGAHPLPHRVRWARPRLALLLAGLLAAVAVAAAVGAGRVLSDESRTRPELQGTLDRLVAEQAGLAPGATAYVDGPRGSWFGAAGVADAGSGTPMRTDARMRLESVSKIYTATLVLQLAQDGSLHIDDTVARWLPGLLPYGKRITVRQLLTMSSGLIDNNDIVNASDRAQRLYLANVKDPRLRAELRATAARVAEDPATAVSEGLWIRWAAWQPLLFTPGSGYHYSNIGYDLLGLIAVRAGGKPLRQLYRERIFVPLGLDATAYDPQGPISGSHAHGYAIRPDGRRVDTTSWHAGVGAEGGIVSNAEDTGIFLSRLMQGTLLDPLQRAVLTGEVLQGGALSGCAGRAYGWSGGGSGYKTEVWVNEVGTRVAVLLLNARHMDTAQAGADEAAHAAMVDLYCNA